MAENQEEILMKLSAATDTLDDIGSELDRSGYENLALVVVGASLDIESVMRALKWRLK